MLIGCAGLHRLERKLFGAPRSARLSASKSIINRRVEEYNLTSKTGCLARLVTLEWIQMTLIVDFIFFILFVVYSIQILVITRKYQSESGSTTSRGAGGEKTWLLIAGVIIVPLLIGFVPEAIANYLSNSLLSQDMQNWISAQLGRWSIALANSSTNPPKIDPPKIDLSTSPFFDTNADVFLFIVRFVIAFVITIVTLELALIAQAHQSRRANRWGGLFEPICFSVRNDSCRRESVFCSHRLGSAFRVYRR
jgi:hypothetical protein